MSTQIKIVVTNNSNQTQDFYFFQEPAAYVGGPTVYANSLLSSPILPNSQSGSDYTFTLDLQYYAGVQQAQGAPVIGQPSGYTSAIRPIDLTPANGGNVANCTDMIIDPALGLTEPAPDAGVEAGAFRIVSPAFDDNLDFYNGGSAMNVDGGGVVLSNFVQVQPSQNLDCQPVLKFFVAVGNYIAGTVMDFTGSSVTAAKCDATQGQYTFNVSYNNDGSWTVTPSDALAKTKGGERPRLGTAAIVLNTSIKNEAGKAVICQGHAGNFGAPIVVDSLTTPGVLSVNSEYQVGPVGGPFKGYMLTALSATGTATFK